MTYKKPGQKAFVYFIHCDGCYKIGWSNDPAIRMAALDAGPVPRMSLAHTFPSTDPPAIEHHLHWHFREKRVRGEWFRLTDDDVAAVRAIQACDSVEQLPEHLNSTKEREAHDASRRLRMAKHFRSLREASGLTRSQVAAQANVTYAKICVMETKGCVPGKDAAIRIAAALGVPVDQVFCQR